MQFTLFGIPFVFRIYHLHPMFVHFPIALFLVAVLFYVWTAIRKKPGSELAGLCNLVTAAVFAWIAALTGDIASDAVKLPNAVVRNIFEIHETLGYVIAGTATFLAIWGIISFRRRPGKPVPLFTILMLLAGLAVILQAYLGGYMVYIGGVAVHP